jgi:OTU domain-containing protein 6
MAEFASENAAESTTAQGVFNETIEMMEDRHEAEMDKLKEEIKESMKKAKKSEKAKLETQALQMQYDLKAKQQDEMDALEEYIETNGPIEVDESKVQKVVVEDEVKAPVSEPEKDTKESKKAKAQRKKDKKAAKEQEKELQKEEIRNGAGPSLRDVELDSISKTLKEKGLQIKDIPSDGHCMYRALSDQLSMTSHQSALDFAALRKMAADYLRTHSEDFAPFIGIEASDPAYEAYCEKVEAVTTAEWGGQLELRALSACLSSPIHVYSANAPMVIMGEEESGAALSLSYHKHYFALGEHYNSVVQVSL